MSSLHLVSGLSSIMRRVGMIENSINREYLENPEYEEGNIYFDLVEEQLAELEYIVYQLHIIRNENINFMHNIDNQDSIELSNNINRLNNDINILEDEYQDISDYIRNEILMR